MGRTTGSKSTERDDDEVATDANSMEPHDGTVNSSTNTRKNQSFKNDGKSLVEAMIGRMLAVELQQRMLITRMVN